MLNYPAYKITYADLDRLKAVAARIFDRSVSPQSRMEIVARSSGFKTYAAFLATLKETPILLWGKQDVEEDCARHLGVSQTGMPYIHGVPLNAIVSAGLAWSERKDVEGAMMRAPNDRLSVLKEDSGRLTDYLDLVDTVRHENVLGGRFAYRSSLSFEEVRNTNSLLKFREAFQGNLLIVVSPRNQRDLCKDRETKKQLVADVGGWMGCRVHLTKHDQFFDLPMETFAIDWTRLQDVRDLMRNCDVVCFDEYDKSEFEAKLYEEGIPIRRSVRQIKDRALDIDNEVIGDFFSVGYYGAARNDYPNDIASLSKDEISNLAVIWLCEILNVVHGCNYEYKRMTNENYLPEQFKRLLVEV